MMLISLPHPSSGLCAESAKPALVPRRSSWEGPRRHMSSVHRSCCITAAQVVSSAHGWPGWPRVPKTEKWQQLHDRPLCGVLSSVGCRWVKSYQLLTGAVVSLTGTLCHRIDGLGGTDPQTLLVPSKPINPVNRTSLSGSRFDN